MIEEKIIEEKVIEEKVIEEKRNFPRRMQNEQVHVDILKASNEQIDNSVRYEGLMKDISHNGIRLHGKHPLEKDAILDLLVEFEADHAKYNLTGCVKWVTETTEHEFVAGLEINDSDNTDITKWHQKFS